MTETIHCHECDKDVETDKIDSATIGGGAYVRVTFPCGTNSDFPQTPLAGAYHHHYD